MHHPSESVLARFEQLVADALNAIRTAHNAREENAIPVAEGVPLFTACKVTRVGPRQLANLKEMPPKSTHS